MLHNRSTYYEKATTILSVTVITDQSFSSGKSLTRSVSRRPRASCLLASLVWVLRNTSEVPRFSGPAPTTCGVSGVSNTRYYFILSKYYCRY